MSLLGVIGRIGAGVLGLGNVLGKQQQSEAEGQLKQAQVQQGQDRNAIDLYGTRQDAQFKAGQQDLDRQTFTTKNRGDVFRQALMAELMPQLMKGVSMPGVPQASGGTFDVASSPGALEAIKAFGSQAHTAQDTPVQFVGGEMLKAPTLTPLPQTSKGSNILSTIARIAQLANAGTMGRDS